MAVDMWSENSSSPRISFSQDLSLSDIVPVETQSHHPSRSSGLSSSFDFDFCPDENEPLTADDFFCDGKILPTEIKKKASSDTYHDTCSVPPPSKTKHSVKQSIRQTDNNLSRESDEKHSSIPEPNSSSGSKSFWRFKRSTSCGSGYGRSLCPLPLLSRSNSTGSAPNSKNSVFPKEGSSIKKNGTSSSKPSPMPYSSYQKPPLRKTNGVKVNPHVLNVPSVNMFGIGTVFFNGREKSRRK